MKRIFQLVLLLALLVTVSMVSCKKDVAPSIDMGYAYFPNQIGKYVVYNVDSIARNSFDYKIDTFRFQLKEVIQSVFSDNTGRPTLQIYRYVKIYNKDTAYSAMQWTFRNVWAENLTTTTAERVESNVRYVKLAFPVTLNKTWNGNAYNTIGEWDYQYTEVNAAKKIGNFSFDSTSTVTQLINQNLIQNQYYVETYAKHVGLVYRQIIDWQNNSHTLSPDSTVGILLYTDSLVDHN